MRFQFVPIPSLPRLAWCARLSTGTEIIQVFHGPWVETRETHFFEGAWDGGCEAGEFWNGTTLVGSGGRLEQGEVLFAAPTDTTVGLTSMRVEDTLLVSNSTVFALVMAGDEPDIRYPDYYFDLVHLRRWGLRRPSASMPTHRGNRFSLHRWENYVVDPDLSIRIQKKPRAPRPSDFSDYSGLLHQTVGAVIANAAHATRKQRYRPVATVSQGYDSTACAAIAARLGCREALTFITEHPDPGQADDSGSEVGRCLGLQMTEYGRSDYLGLPDFVEAEFAASCPYPGGTPLAIAARQLEGAIALMGDRGDQVWGLDETWNLPDVMCPETSGTSGTSFTEFRLRLGYLHFSVALIGATHRQQLQRIAESDEMKPWSVPGQYDRPIPRRLVEEAGVGRELFGQTKQFGASILGLSEPSAADFDAFFEAQPVPRWLRESRRFRLRELPSDLLALLHWLSATRWQGKRMRLYKALLPLTMQSPRKKRGARALGRAGLPDSKYLYLYHWGFERVKTRYHPATPRTSSPDIRADHGDDSASAST